MTRIVAVAALLLAGCGGTDPAPAAQVYAVSICSCLPSQAGRCIDVPGQGSVTCGPWQIQAGAPTTWEWIGSNSACPVEDCRMVGLRPVDDACGVQAVCAEPLPAQ